jgi:hypothetical protein
MTDRDHFAAAALTGLLSNIPRYQLEPLTRQAWEIADFMLRKREQAHGGCPSGLDPEADRKSVASQRCRDTGGQPFDSAPTTTDWRSHIRPPDAADREAIRKCDEAWGTDVGAEPVAWIVHSGDLRWFAWAKPTDGIYEGPIVPLYRQPQTCPHVVGRTTQHCSLTPFTLTDEERAAVQLCAYYGLPDRYAATLRSLLERTK